MQAEQQRAVNRQTLRALGDALQFVQRGRRQRRKTERRQRKLRAFQAQCRECQQTAEHESHQHADCKCGDHGETEMHHAQTASVGSQAEEGRMAEIDLPQITHADIQPDEQDAVDREQCEQAQHVRVADSQRNTGEKNKGEELSAVDEQNSFQLSFLKLSLC